MTKPTAEEMVATLGPDETIDITVSRDVLIGLADDIEYANKHREDET